MTDQWEPVDLSPLDPPRGPEWAARVEATRRAAAAIVERRTMAPGTAGHRERLGSADPGRGGRPAGPARRGRCAAPRIGRLSPAIAWARRAASVCSARRRSPMVARRQAPSCARILRRAGAMSWATRRTAVLVLLAVFLVGGAAGWVAWKRWWTRSTGLARHGDGETPDRPDEDEPFDDDAEEDFLETLGLSRAQLDSVDHLLDRREDRLEDYWKSRLPDLQVLVDSSRQEIRARADPRAARQRTTDGSARSRARTEP